MNLFEQTKRRVMFAGLLLTLLAGCKPAVPPSLEFTGETMGTTYNIVVVDAGDTKARIIESALQETLAVVNRQMSNWDPDSEVSRLNKNLTTLPVTLSSELISVIVAAGDVHRHSRGLFDITLAPLIELWGFGSEGTDNAVPAEELINAALERVGHQQLLVVDPSALTLSKGHPEVSVNLAAIAKGYGIDQLARTLESFGFSNFMVEIGGDLYTRGNSVSGKPWVIGIERPEAGTRSVFRRVSVTERGMATSGDYRNVFQEDGKRYSHVIDPTSGFPIDHNTASATVVTESAMLADAWATAMLVLGSEKGIMVAEEQQLAVQFIDRNESGFSQVESAAFKQFVKENQVVAQ